MRWLRRNPGGPVLPECACPPGCPARCVPERSCDEPECACYQLWVLECDLATEQTAHLSNEELHQMAIDAWSPP